MPDISPAIIPVLLGSLLIFIVIPYLVIKGVVKQAVVWYLRRRQERSG